MSKFNEGDVVYSDAFESCRGKKFRVYDPERDHDGDIKIVPEGKKDSCWEYHPEDDLHLAEPKAPVAPQPPTQSVTSEAGFEVTSENANQEVNTMAQVDRSLVRVVLIDNDKGLDVSKSLVKDFGTFVLEGSQDELIREILMDPDHKVDSVLRAHNAVRAKEVDLDILNRTGNEVKLREVKLKDLTFKVSAA